MIPGEMIRNFLRKTVGFRNDSANPTGSAHGKLSNLINVNVPAIINNTVLNATAVAIPGSTVRKEFLTERYVNGSTEVERKAFTVPLGGMVRLTYELKSTSGGYTSTCTTYIDGVAQTPGTTTSTSYVVVTQDFLVKKDSFISMRLKNSSTDGRASIRNVRLVYEVGYGGTIIMD